MKINLNKKMADLDGKDVKQDEKPVTLKTVCLGALMSSVPGDEQLTVADVEKRYDLMLRLNKGGQQEFTPEEVSMIKARIPKFWALLISGQACQMLNGD